MKVALVAPSGVPFAVGGAEKLWWGLTTYVNRHTPHAMELIKLPSPERNFWDLVDSYRRFATLNLDHFDLVISTKYPAWMVAHGNHVVFLQHTLRGLYDTYPPRLPLVPAKLPGAAQSLWQLLQRPGLERDALPEIFERLDGLRSSRALTDDDRERLAAFPGPFARAVVHALDRIGLSRKAIRRYLAISKTVVERKDYFPEGADVEVLPHPSDLEGFRCESGEFVFTASRLDGPKRVDLLIRAYRRCKTDVPLLVAGEGPEGGALRALAGDDPRIRFTGRLTDDELVAHYARSHLVVFIPFQEDMGLITLEAMKSGKPVLTVDDAGGVTEFVRDGVNGRVVRPEVDALARAIDDMLADRERLRAMGEAALATGAEVTWQRTAKTLLAVRDAREAAAGSPAEKWGQTPFSGQLPATLEMGQAALPKMGSDPIFRTRILVLNTFGVYPPNSGGKKRIFYLYQALSRHADVTLLNLGPPASSSESREFSPHYREIRIPPGERFQAAEAALQKALRRSVTDIAALLHAQEIPALASAMADLCVEANIVVASHVYLAPFIAKHWSGEVWYDAHNVEADMKADILGVDRLAAPLVDAGSEKRGQTPFEKMGSDPFFPQGAARDAVGPIATTKPSAAKPPATLVNARNEARDGITAASIVARVAEAEGTLVRAATRVFATSAQDAQRLADLYGRDVATIEEVPNGVLLPDDPWLEPERRAALKASLGFGDRPLALFVGSDHGPNHDAAEIVVEVAKKLPDWAFWVVGSICNHKRLQSAPGNVYRLGLVTEGELVAVFRAADVGLNPMLRGSGTNLKILDYAAHGVLALSTEIGARGIGFVDGEHYLGCVPDGFAAALEALQRELPSPRLAIRTAARRLVEQRFGWQVIADRIAAEWKRQ